MKGLSPLPETTLKGMCSRSAFTEGSAHSVEPHRRATHREDAFVVHQQSGRRACQQLGSIARGCTALTPHGKAVLYPRPQPPTPTPPHPERPPEKRMPIRRLASNTVLCGFCAAWLRAASPTSRSSSVKATCSSPSSQLGPTISSRPSCNKAKYCHARAGCGGVGNATVACRQRPCRRKAEGRHMVVVTHRQLSAITPTILGVVRLPLSFLMICTEPFCHTPTQLHMERGGGWTSPEIRRAEQGQEPPAGNCISKASGQPGASQGTADSQRLATEAQGNRQAQRARQTAPEACAQIDADGFALILGRWGHWAR